MRPIDPLVETLAAAFAPLKCGVDLVGHGETVRVHVFDDTQSADMRDEVVRRAWPLAELQDSRALKSAIFATRLELGEAGYCLQAWRPQA